MIQEDILAFHQNHVKIYLNQIQMEKNLDKLQVQYIDYYQ